MARLENNKRVEEMTTCKVYRSKRESLLYKHPSGFTSEAIGTPEVLPSVSDSAEH